MGAGGSCFVCLGDKQEPFKLQGLDLQRIAERPTEDNEFEELSPLDWRPAQARYGRILITPFARMHTGPQILHKYRR